KLLGKALAKEPNSRFQSMREMAEAIARSRRRVYRSITGEASVDVPRHSATQRVLKASSWSTRIGWPAVAMLVAFVGAGAGFVFSRLNRPAAKIEGGAILVVTRPSGAAVEVDGHPFAEPTPTMIPYLGAGAHTVKLKKGK